MTHSKKINITSLNIGDAFVFEGNFHVLTSMKNLSTSFNELNTICEGEECNLRLNKNEIITLKEKTTISPPTQTSFSRVNKIRNETGHLVRANFNNSNLISEGPDEWPSRTKRKKISKAQEKTRDDCAEDLMNKASFNKRYDKKKNVKPPAKSKSDVAYAICALQATGRGSQINRGRPCKDPPCHKEKKKKTQKESYMIESWNRLNTLRNAIRRTSE